MLSVIVESLGEVTILHCAGRIVAGNESNLLRKAVLSQLDSRTVVLDLAQVETIDGGGMGTLVFLQLSARAAGTELKLMNPASHVRELLELTNLDSVFDVYASEDDPLGEPAFYRYD